MRTAKLESLSPDERRELITRLYKRQNGLCYVDRQAINLHVHAVDVDHIIALARGGADDESNWALAHATCNRSKGTRDLQLQRILSDFRQHLQKYAAGTDEDGAGRSFTLKQALAELRPDRMEAGLTIRDSEIEIAWQTEDGSPMSESYPLLVDSSTPSAKSFVGMIPFTCVHHDEDINPRSIADLEPMIEEFYNGNPQLQPSLATVTIEGNEGRAPILVFDGQHKAAAQLYARRDRLLVRVFVNCDRERLKETNYRAHTKLAQVHFPQLINDKVGADLFKEEFSQYVQGADPAKISEDTFLRKGVQRIQKSEYRSYFGNSLRYEVLVGKAGAQRNKILDFTETVMPRSTRYPLSYDTLQKAMLDVMLFLKPAKDTLDLTGSFRQLERENLIRLLNIFVEEVLANGRFDLNLGVRRMEEKLEKDPQSIPDSHLRAYRICRKAAMMVWCEELKRAIRLLLAARARYKEANWGERRPLWAQMLDEDWQQVRKMIQAIRDHRVWAESVNQDIVAAIASTKQKDWKDILLRGTLPGRREPLLPLLDSQYMFQSALEH
ncbi:MAG: HNH endonuclease [Candidatus Acidiferrales bacterium]